MSNQQFRDQMKSSIEAKDWDKAFAIGDAWSKQERDRLPGEFFSLMSTIGILRGHPESAEALLPEAVARMK